MTLLFADDELLALAPLLRTLYRSGHRCYFATNVASALQILSERKVDLVITDLLLPSFGEPYGGFQLIKRIRMSTVHMQTSNEVPAIIFTAAPYDETNQQATELDALVINKWDVSILLSFVDRLAGELSN